MAITLKGNGQAIVQILQYRLSSEWSTNSTSFVDVTGMNVTITPTSSTNKILILVNIEAFHPGSLQDEFRVTRNGSDILPSLGGRLWFSTGYYGSGTTGNGSTTYIDSPASTSALTYQVQARNRHSATFYLGRDWNNESFSGMNTITIMEISQS